MDVPTMLPILKVEGLAATRLHEGTLRRGAFWRDIRATERLPGSCMPGEAPMGRRARKAALEVLVSFEPARFAADAAWRALTNRFSRSTDVRPV